MADRATRAETPPSTEGDPRSGRGAQRRRPIPCSAAARRARRHADGSVEVRVHAPNATRVEVAFFGAAIGEPERLRVLMEARDGRSGRPLRRPRGTRAS
ncbi:MAG: hypothetical protein R3B82_25845 [Sandaracinaceae bacterium]